MATTTGWTQAESSIHAYRYLVWTARRATRWYNVSDLSGLITGGKARAAGWLYLLLAALLTLGSLLV